MHKVIDAQVVGARCNVGRSTVGKRVGRKYLKAGRLAGAAVGGGAGNHVGKCSIVKKLSRGNGVQEPAKIYARNGEIGLLANGQDLANIASRNRGIG